MKKKITVATVQMEIKPLNIAANLKKAKESLGEILHNSRCDLVVFPEYLITGPIPKNLEFAISLNSEPIKYFQELARRFNIYIVPGSFVQKVNSSYFNTSLLIDNKGKIVLEYRKNHLWIPEKKYLASGKGINIAKVLIGNIGIIICWDLAFPEICQQLAKMGVDIICCPSYWTVNDGKPLHKKYGASTEQRFIDILCPARAIENEVLFIYANAAGEAKVPLKTRMWTSAQIGRSQICIPINGTVVKIDDNSEGFIIYEYDRQISKDAEKNYQIKTDLQSFH